MAEYERSIVIHAPIAKLYDFHLYTPNAGLIQPLGFKVISVDMPPEVEVGAEVALKMRVYGLPQTWRVVWDALEPPAGQPSRALLIDRAVKSPFRAFRHRHEFVEEGENTTRMTDHIVYEPPVWAIGKLGRWVVHAELDGMFRGRQAMTKRILEASQLPAGETVLNGEQVAAVIGVRHAAEREVEAQAADDDAQPKGGSAA